MGILIPIENHTPFIDNPKYPMPLYLINFKLFVFWFPEFIASLGLTVQITESADYSDQADDTHEFAH